MQDLQSYPLSLLVKHIQVIFNTNSTPTITILHARLHSRVINQNNWWRNKFNRMKKYTNFFRDDFIDENTNPTQKWRPNPPSSKTTFFQTIHFH